MRSDLDTARGIFWWAVVPLLLLVVSGSVFASPNWHVLVCVAPVESGSEFDACEPVLISAGFVRPGVVVNARANELEDAWYAFEDIGAGFDVWVENTDTWVPYSSFSGWGSFFLAGGGSGGADEWTVEDLDLSQAASAFAAAFMVCWMFWGLGKGVGLLVGFLRRV